MSLARYHRRWLRNHTNQGFTLIELLVAIAIIGIMVGLLLPAVQSGREAARRMSCSNQFKQIGLGLHNYHSAYDYLPAGAGGSDSLTGTVRGHNNSRLAATVGLLPFIEQQALWEQISNPWQHPTSGQPAFPAMGPVPFWPNTGVAVAGDEYLPWYTQVSNYRCPSDASLLTSWGQTNYAVCYGDSFRAIGNDLGTQPGSKRGMFMKVDSTTTPRASGRLGFRDCLDGTSNTIAMGEIANSQQSRELTGNVVNGVNGIGNAGGAQLCLDQVDPEWPRYYKPGATLWTVAVHGGTWADGQVKNGGFVTVLPPNGPSCTGLNNENNAVITASSLHQGGCHVL